jgi:hypothetical protein
MPSKIVDKLMAKSSANLSNRVKSSILPLPNMIDIPISWISAEHMSGTYCAHALHDTALCHCSI